MPIISQMMSLHAHHFILYFSPHLHGKKLIIVRQIIEGQAKTAGRNPTPPVSFSNLNLAISIQAKLQSSFLRSFSPQALSGEQESRKAGSPAGCRF